MALEMTQELRREIQEKDMRIVTLERVSGLRNEEIEEEVLRRVEVLSPFISIFFQMNEYLYGKLFSNAFFFFRNLSKFLYS